MTDITSDLNACLAGKSAKPLRLSPYTTDKLDEFLKEAYQINSGITDLTASLRTIRSSYLSTSSTSTSSAATRRTRRPNDPKRPLTDRDRTAIDTQAKTVLRQLLSAVTRLDQVEHVRHEAALNLSLSKRSKSGLGALGRWAAGGAVTARSPEEADVDARETMLAAHRQSIVCYLKDRLGETSAYQLDMMEIRLRRAEERTKSVLAESPVVGSSRQPGTQWPTKKDLSAQTAQAESGEDRANGDAYQLSEEQMQLFARENQDLLRHFEDQRDQLKATQKSLEEIAELQTALATNLDTQQVHIDQLVQDSFFTTENVGRGNKELKRASERTSTAMVLFHSTCAFCLFLVVWDLAF